MYALIIYMYWQLLPVNYKLKFPSTVACKYHSTFMQEKHQAFHEFSMFTHGNQSPCSACECRQPPSHMPGSISTVNLHQSWNTWLCMYSYIEVLCGKASWLMVFFFDLFLHLVFWASSGSSRDPARYCSILMASRECGIHGLWLGWLELCPAAEETLGCVFHLIRRHLYSLLAITNRL